MRRKQAAPQRKEGAGSPTPPPASPTPPPELLQGFCEQGPSEEDLVPAPPAPAPPAPVPAQHPSSSSSSSFKQVGGEVSVPTAQQQQHLGVLAELIVATKAGGQLNGSTPPPAAVCLQVFEKRTWWRRYASHPVLLLSWRCPGEDEHGPKHQVCCQLPVGNKSNRLLALLQQGHLAFSIQQLQHNDDSSAGSSQQASQHSPQLLRPVQYATLTAADSEYESAFGCDVVMMPTQQAVQAGLDRCSMLAAAAARAAGGATASLANQPALLEAVAPRLPAQHVSLMAAATAPELLQQQHQEAHQQQQQQQEVEGSEQAPKAAVTLWRLQLCVTQTALSTQGDAEQQQQQAVGLECALSWLLPHWSCSSSKPADDGRESGFDAADVYRVTKPSGLEAQLQGTPAGLQPQLRPYQRRAVAWMMGLERGQHASAAAAQEAAQAAAAAAAAGSSVSSSLQQLLACLLQPYSQWQSVLLLLTPPMQQQQAGDGNSSAGAAAAAAGLASAAAAPFGLRRLFVHPELGQLCSEAPQQPPQVPGGILADEMGLGKTVELLSIIMCNRFQPSGAGQQQEQEQQQEHAGASPAEQPRQQTTPSRSSAGATNSGSKSNCCARCRESFGVPYDFGGSGRVAQAAALTHDNGGDDGGDDTDDYVPRKPRSKRAVSGKQQQQKQKQPAHGTKRSARSQQLPPLPPQPQLHGAGHHGPKRRRVVPKRLQDGADADDDAAAEQPSSTAVARGRRGAAAAAAADADAVSSGGGGGGGGSELLCSLCMRGIALQEVEQDCGTTLIVVPANILVQWVDELERHTIPGSLSIKVYAGQPQASTPAPAAASGRSSRSRSRSPAGSASSNSNARGAAAATAAGGRAAASNEVVTAAQLAGADIVLTSYDVIRREVSLQPQTEAERSLRHRKRYAVVPTPLSRLVFWRLVMDEAQLAGGATKVAEMAQHIRARHRWAITGTPISHGGRADIVGLLKFLQVHHIPQGVGELLRLLCPVTGGVMWRTAKADVAAEMGIPPQHHHTTVLRLSAIERHWYNRSHQDCAAKARKVLQDALHSFILGRDYGGRRSDHTAVAAAQAAAKRAVAAAIAAGGASDQLQHESSTAGGMLDLVLGPAQLKKLLLPLLRLRQACCHPSVGASGIRAIISNSSGSGHGSNSSGKPLTMDQILSVLISRARVEAEEAQRQLAGALNGLAALLWLDRQCAEAVAAYREVLALSDPASRGDVRLDSFQLLHTLHNLAELLAELARKHKQQQQPQRRRALPSAAAAGVTDDQPYGPGVPRTLRDSSLASEAAAIREQYLAQRQAELATAHQAYAKAAKDALPAGQQQQHKRKRKRGGGSSQQAAATGWSRGGGAGSSRQAAAFLGELLPGTGAEEAGSDDADDDSMDVDGSADDNSASAGWYVSVIDALRTAGVDEEVAEAIRGKLQESDTYKHKQQKNATTLANRFNNMGGLKLLLAQELAAINKHQAACLTTLQALQGAVGGGSGDGPDEQLIEQAGQCGRCRAEMGVLGRVCKHCKLDEDMHTWEARLFQLSTKALATGTQLDASEAARQAQAATLSRVVGRGGLNEQATEASGGAAAAAAGAVGLCSGAGVRRADGAAVSEAQIVRHPSEAERVLRMLQQQIGKLGMASYLPGVKEAAKQHLEQLEGSRKLFVAANSLSLAQRQLLYAHDELSMSVLRISTRAEGEQVSAQEALYKLSPAEQVVKQEELGIEKAVAAGELKRALGTLNYLKTIAGARTRVAAVAAAAGAAAGGDKAAGGRLVSSAAGGQQQQQQEADKPADPRAAAAAAALQRAAAAGSDPSSSAAGDAGAAAQGSPHHHQQQEQQQQQQQAVAETAAAGAAGAAAAEEGPPVEKCPICFCAVDAAAAVLPCGHVLCCDCADALVAQIPPLTPAAQRHINCPSCRAHTHVTDIAFVNSEHSTKHAYVQTTSTVTAAGSVVAAAAAAALEAARALAGGGGSGPRTTAADATAGDPAAAAAAAGPAAAANDYPFKGEQQLVLSGSYGTKIEAVVRRILFVLQTDPSSKVLVFSSWSDVLAIASHALGDNGVRHVFAKDRKGLLHALEAFKGCQVLPDAADVLGSPAAGAGAAGAASGSSGSGGSSSGAQQQEDEDEDDGGQGLDGMDVDVADSPDDAAGQQAEEEEEQQQQPAAAAAAAAGAAAGPSLSAGTGPRVLLMLVSQGGLGLNLTEAQHVVLLEPLLDPALDVQAIGRVSRFGQTRETHVHRFIVQDTVEENVARLSHERAAAMNMSAAVPVKGGSGGAAEAAQLTVREVAALVCSRWGEGRDML